jgi:protein KIBRA
LSLQFMLQPKQKDIQSPSIRRIVSRPSGSGPSSAMSSQQGTLKEESSDDSTTISSQASTLTRNIDPELMMSLHVIEDMMTSDDIVIPSEPCKAFQLDSFLGKTNSSSSSISKTTDRETNTECVFLQPSAAAGARTKHTQSKESVVKRSKTFSPRDAGDKGYLSSVKLNRSDSDGSMPLYKKLPFQHKMTERRSLRLPKPALLTRPTLQSMRSGQCSQEDSMPLATKLQLKRSRRLARTKEHVMETPLDLELDLAAQQTKLDLLQSDIGRLKGIQKKLEDAKANGAVQESMSWLHDHEYLQTLLTKVHRP